MKYLELATKIALNNRSAKTFLFGVVAERTDGAVVVSTNIRTQFPEPSAHAEYRLLRKCDWGCTMWIARVDREGRWAMAKPCRWCHTLIKNKGVKRVYYTIGPEEYGVWKP